MDADIEKMHMQSIEEYILDEGKTVTYRWLSKVLNVHVNISKELLSKFSSDPSHENNVFLTYLISGKLKDGTYSVLVVDQDKFEEAKLDFEFITSHHVYSVQKNKETPSANLLYMVNSEKVENELDVSKQIGAIKCASSIQRAEDELSNLRLNSFLKNVPSVTAAPAKKITPPSDKKEKEENAETPDNKKADVKKSPEKKSKAAGGIAAMFSAQASKSAGASAANSSAKPKAKPPAKKGGINSFFSKAPKTESPPKDQPNSKQQTDEAMDVEICEEPSDKSDVKKEEPEVEVISSPAEKSNSKEGPTLKSNGKTPKTKPKKKSKPKSSSKTAKTRKRIKVIDSDSDDDMFASEREDSPEPIASRSPSPPPARKIIDSDDEVIPATPQPENETKNHRKRKVVKDKSYMDEDGFVVTEKVTVYESCSESESENKDNAKKPKEEEPAEKPSSTEPAPKVEKPTASKDTKKKTTKKTVSPAKNKQSSLMNFFKKV